MTNNADPDLILSLADNGSKKCPVDGVSGGVQEFIITRLPNTQSVCFTVERLELTYFDIQISPGVSYKLRARCPASSN